jgi:hypothetical protein
MGDVSALRRYRAYLEAIDEEAARTASEDEYLDLLAPSEVIDLLCARDEIEQQTLDADQRADVARLDDLLVKHGRVVTENSSSTGEPGSQWWWRLEQSPRVHGDALATVEEE